MKRKYHGLLALLLVIGLLFTACGSSETPVNPDNGTGGGTEGKPDDPLNDLLFGRDPSYYEATLVSGPNGETPTPAADVTLSEEDYKKIREGGYTAVLCWGSEGGEWNNGVSYGLKDEFAKMGIEIIAVSNAELDITKQKSDVESVMALNPDIVISLPIDPVAGREVYAPVIDAGKTLVFIDNGVNDYSAGKDYTGISTSDAFGMGRTAADLIVEACGGGGNIAVVYYDSDFFVTNNRDGMVEYTLRTKYHDKVNVKCFGFVKTTECGDVCNAILAQFPEVDGIFVSWDVAAEPIVSELKANGRDDVKVVAMDLCATNDLDCVKGGNVYGKVCDKPYEIGVVAARMAAYQLLGREAPAFVCCDVVVAKKETMLQAWNEAMHCDPSEEVMEVIKQNQG